MIYAAAAFVVLAFYLCCIWPTRWVDVRRVAHGGKLGKRVFQISDLHVERLRVSAETLRRLIVREQPDLIVLTGDYTERERHLPKVDAYLSAIRSTGVPTYAVLGNHDYRLRDRLPKLVELFRRHGIPLLRNGSVDLSYCRLVGIDDDHTGMSRVGKAFRNVREGEAVVVITHDPTVTLKLKRPYYYLMSGHFHGGQFRLPFVFRWRKKGPLPLRGIVRGLHRDERGTFYISKGLGQTSINARFLIRCEVTVHDL